MVEGSPPVDLVLARTQEGSGYQPSRHPAVPDVGSKASWPQRNPREPMQGSGPGVQSDPQLTHP